MADRDIPRGQGRAQRKSKVAPRRVYLTWLKGSTTCARILSVESTHERKTRYKSLHDAHEKQKESFEVFALDDECRGFMTEKHKFPSYLFSETWSKSNGFAGSSRLPEGNSGHFLLLSSRRLTQVDSYMVPFAGQDDWWKAGLLLA